MNKIIPFPTKAGLMSIDENLPVYKTDDLGEAIYQFALEMGIVREPHFIRRKKPKIKEINHETN
ncbi:hypothetical protein AGMMS50255_6890 [Spirochaetia bacterium]|nr:hypothetical protein AGMMS50255_6890 [Spirochaetia bacterium]